MRQNTFGSMGSKVKSGNDKKETSLDSDEKELVLTDTGFSTIGNVDIIFNKPLFGIEDMKGMNLTLLNEM